MRCTNFLAERDLLPPARSESAVPGCRLLMSPSDGPNEPRTLAATPTDQMRQEAPTNKRRLSGTYRFADQAAQVSKAVAENVMGSTRGGLRVGGALWAAGTAHNDPIAVAAATIQRRYHRRSAQKLKLTRTALLARLRLEQQILVGIRILAASLALLLIFTAVLKHDMRPEATYDLRQSIVSGFSLDSLDSIRDIDGFTQYYTTLSQQTQERLAISSTRFADSTGSILLAGALRKFDFPTIYTSAQAHPAISTSFTLTGIVAFRYGLQAHRGAYAVRKQLWDHGTTESCWAWRMGTHPVLEFAAHDLGPLNDEQRVESVSSPVSLPWPDGASLVFQAVVVNQTHAEFFSSSSSTDAPLVVSTGAVRLPRPVTDCSARILRVGDEVPQRVTAVCSSRSAQPPPECPIGTEL